MTSSSSRPPRSGPRSGSAGGGARAAPHGPPPPPCPPDDIARDWVELQAYYREHGRDPDECVVAHENFLHLVMTDDPARAREEQHRAFLKGMSAERGPKYLESVYLFGTPDEVIASLQARIDAGVEKF